MGGLDASAIVFSEALASPPPIPTLPHEGEGLFRTSFVLCDCLSAAFKHGLSDKN
jgi:hypothetical protein